MSPTTYLAPTAEPTFLRGITNTSSNTSTALSETLLIIIVTVASIAVITIATLLYLYLKRQSNQYDTKESLGGDTDQFNSNFAVTKALRRLTNHFNFGRISSNASVSGANTIDEEPRLNTSKIFAPRKQLRVSNRPNELSFTDTINFGTVVDNLEGENDDSYIKEPNSSAQLDSSNSCRSDMGLITANTDIDASPKLSEAHRSFYSFMATFTRSSFAVTPSSTRNPTFKSTVMPPAPKYPPPKPPAQSNRPLSPTTQSSSASAPEKPFVGVPRVKLTPAPQYASPIQSARSPRSPNGDIDNSSSVRITSPTPPSQSTAENLSSSATTQRNNSTHFKSPGTPSRPIASDPNPTSSVTTLSKNYPSPSSSGTVSTNTINPITTYSATTLSNNNPNSSFSGTASSTLAPSNLETTQKPKSPRSNKFDESFDLYNSYNYSYTDPKISLQSETKSTHVMMQQSPMSPAMKMKTRTISSETTTTESSGRSYASSTNSTAPGSQSPKNLLNQPSYQSSNQSSVSYAPSPTPSQILSSFKPRNRTLSTEPVDSAYNSQVSPISSQKGVPIQSPFKLPNIQSMVSVSVTDKVRSSNGLPSQSSSPKIPPRVRKEDIEKGFYDFKA